MDLKARLKNVFFLLVVVSFFNNAYAQDSVSATVATTTKSNASDVHSVFDVSSIEFKRAVQSYNARQYESSLSLLKKIKDQEDLRTGYNYLSGLNYYKIQNYELSEKYMSEVVKDFSYKEVASAYFYIGLSQYQKGQYEQAVNSFELATDTSTDASLDRKSEIMIEKAVQIQNQIERDKIKWTVGLGAGLQSDTNVLNTKETDKSYKGYALSWNAFVAYKAYSDKDSLFEPMLYYSDMLTYDSSFKDDTDLKKSDATQILLSLPFKVRYNAFTSRSSLNLGYYLLPNDANQKSLAITLFFFRQDVSIPVNKEYDASIKVVVGRDQSQLSYSDAADNQNSVKFELGTGFDYHLPTKQGHTVSTLLGYIINSAQGDNAKYNKYYIDLSYVMPSFLETESTFKSEYSSANYFKSSNDRKDSSLSISYALSKDVSEHSNMSLIATQNYNYSTVDTNKYDDTVIGLQWGAIFKF